MHNNVKGVNMHFDQKIFVFLALLSLFWCSGDVIDREYLTYGQKALVLNCVS